VATLWDLVWKGLITNDTFRALRAFTQPPPRRKGRAALTLQPDRPAAVPSGSRAFRTRRVAPPSAEGRWSLVGARAPMRSSPTEWSAATAHQLLTRYGVVTREVAAAEGISGGFSAVYDVLKALEEAGKIRRGYFVAGVGATQFALPAALDLLRALRELPEDPEVVLLSATDPANPYGTILPWPADPSRQDGARRMTRSAGSLVLLVNGALGAYISRGARQLLVFLPEDDPLRATTGRAIAQRLAGLAREAGMLIAEVNGTATAQHPLAPFLVQAGFVPSAMGYMVPRVRTGPITPRRERRIPAPDDEGTPGDEAAGATAPARTSNPFGRPRGGRA
jgi:ATP-dependent Lhr-like helicase